MHFKYERSYMSTSRIVWQRSLGCFLLILLTYLVYANTFQASWHLDDYANIVRNEKIHLADLSYSSIVKTFYACPWQDDKLWRPVACLTFAINWFFGQNKVFGYHLVNLIIHCAAACFLLQTILLLFRTPALTGRYNDRGAPYWIALMATTLWTIHPIQTQAVTYLVQRMAELAGFFYIVGLYCFLRGRLEKDKIARTFWFLGTGCSYLLALGAKENSVILPLALVLVEVIFFRVKLFATTRRQFIIASSISGAILLGTILVLFLNKELMNTFIKNYNLRYFSLDERLMTEFRILIKYLLQICYPNPNLLSIEHDVTLSTSLFSPWTTLPAMVAIFSLLWGALFMTSRTPLASFGVLFFLLHHIIESSILPLELIFEHRNYIPSMFFFGGFAGGVYQVLLLFKKRSLVVHRILAFSIGLITVFICIGAYSRNADWRTEKSLWEDSVAKAPNSARSYHNLAWGYYETIGDTEKSLSLYRQAINGNSHRKKSSGASYLNIANIYYNNNEYQRAIEFYRDSLDHDPDNYKAYLRLAYSCIGLSDWNQAELTIDRILNLGERDSEIYRVKGIIHLNKNEPEVALKWFRRCNVFEWETLAGMGQSLFLMGYYERSDFYLRCAQALVPNKPFLILNRLDLFLAANQNGKALRMADQFVKSLPVGRVGSYLSELMENRSFYPLNYKRIIPLIKDALGNALIEFDQQQTLMALVK
jgi:protein O-mannosyl-transferase